MSHKIQRTYTACGHTTITTAYHRFNAGPRKQAGSCPTCCALATFLVKHGIADIPEKLAALATHAYATPSGSARNIKATLEHFAVLYPHDLPLVILSKGKHEDIGWAERALAGTPKPKRYESQATAVAKLVKKGLVKMFPGRKVAVTSSHNSVNARVAGLTNEEHDQAYKAFGCHQSGHYNGMEDIYEETNRRDDIPQVQYLSIGSDY